MPSHQATAPIVLNTSAMVCYFHSRVQGQNNENSLADGVMFLVKNQRSDGLWPYCNINGLDKLIWRYQKYMGEMHEGLRLLKARQINILWGLLASRSNIVLHGVCIRK